MDGLQDLLRLMKGRGESGARRPSLCLCTHDNVVLLRALELYGSEYPAS